MSSEVARIREQLHRAYAGEAWHGPSLREVLVDVDAYTASVRRIEGAHSIWELVLHIIAWENEAVARLEGNGRELPSEEDWPNPGEGERAWGEVLEGLETAHQRLMEAIGRLDDDGLDQKVKNREETVYALLHGVIQHNLYHAGQIAILKKSQPAAA